MVLGYRGDTQHKKQNDALSTRKSPSALLCFSDQAAKRRTHPPTPTSRGALLLLLLLLLFLRLMHLRLFARRRSRRRRRRRWRRRPAGHRILLVNDLERGLVWPVLHPVVGFLVFPPVAASDTRQTHCMFLLVIRGWGDRWIEMAFNKRINNPRKVAH